MIVDMAGVRSPLKPITAGAALFRFDLEIATREVVSMHNNIHILCFPQRLQFLISMPLTKC